MQKIKVEVKQKRTEKEAIEFEVWLECRTRETQPQIKGYVV